MAVYKVIQDIEAEDKLIGPLGLKGFIYAVIAVFCGFIDFRLFITSGLGPLRWLIILIFLLPMLLFGLLASPLGREQPTEVWLLSRIRFFAKPRRRIWDQSGIQELVTITAPKKPTRVLTKNLSQEEVKSRLKALSTTLDSRGWAVKNVGVTTELPYSYSPAPEDSDRLVTASELPKEVPPVEVQAADDILDEKNNKVAMKFQSLIKKADDDRKKALISRVKKAEEERRKTEEEHQQTRAEEPKRVKKEVDVSVLDRMNVAVVNPDYTTFTNHKVIEPGQKISGRARQQIEETDQEKSLLKRLHQEEAEIHARAPRFKPKAPLKRHEAHATEVTQTQQVANMNLAQTDNVLPLSVASVQHLANRQEVAKQVGPNEVEVDLH